MIHWLRPNENGAAACGAGDLVDLDRDPNFVTCPACLAFVKDVQGFGPLRCAWTATGRIEPGATGSWTWYVDRGRVAVQMIAVFDGEHRATSPLTVVDRWCGVLPFHPGIVVWGGCGVGGTYRNDTPRPLDTVFAITVRDLAPAEELET